MQQRRNVKEYLDELKSRRHENPETARHMDPDNSQKQSLETHERIRLLSNEKTTFGSKGSFREKGFAGERER